MRLRSRALSALAGLSVLGSMFLTGTPANAQTTYEIGVGADFFESGVPGFSGRFYPGSVKVHEGDTLHFDFGFLGFAQPNVYPQEIMGESDVQIGEPGSFILYDPDEGPKALKFDTEVFFDEGTDCGAIDNPCVWGPNTEPFFPAEREDGFDVYARVDAPAGTTLWAASLSSSDVNVNFKVEVVEEAEATSTQAELDTRADALLTKDIEDAAALHNRMDSKKTWHLNAAGQKVYDVFVGASAGPIEMLYSYPRKTTIRDGQRVQFHFMMQGEIHTATFGGAKAKEVLFNFIVPACDPDGDEGPLADVEPTGFDPVTEFPTCPEGTLLEADLHEDLPWAVGDGKVANASDYENSGLQFPHFPEASPWDENPDPWTLRFPNESPDKGFKFICLVHGGFMGGNIIVK